MQKKVIILSPVPYSNLPKLTGILVPLLFSILVPTYALSPFIIVQSSNFASCFSQTVPLRV